MSTRLTKALREHILEEMLRHRFREEFVQIVAERARIVNVVYDDTFSKKQRDLMNSLPEGWLPNANSVSVKLGEHYEGITFNGLGRGDVAGPGIDRVLTSGWKECPEEIKRRIPKSREFSCLASYPHDHKLSLDYGKIYRRTMDLKVAYQNAASEADAALRSFASIKALLKAWPECEPFLPKGATPKPALPAIPTESLNEMFKLPVAA